jgi:hypothetical protein
MQERDNGFYHCVMGAQYDPDAAAGTSMPSDQDLQYFLLHLSDYF